MDFKTIAVVDCVSAGNRIAVPQVVVRSQRAEIFPDGLLGIVVRKRLSRWESACRGSSSTEPAIPRWARRAAARTNI